MKDEQRFVINSIKTNKNSSDSAIRSAIRYF